MHYDSAAALGPLDDLTTAVPVPHAENGIAAVGNGSGRELSAASCDNRIQHPVEVAIDFLVAESQHGKAAAGYYLVTFTVVVHSPFVNVAVQFDDH